MRSVPTVQSWGNQDYRYHQSTTTSLLIYCGRVFSLHFPAKIVGQSIQQFARSRQHSTRAAWLILITCFLLKKIICNFKKLFSNKNCPDVWWSDKFCKISQNTSQRNKVSREDGPLQDLPSKWPGENDEITGQFWEGGESPAAAVEIILFWVRLAAAKLQSKHYNYNWFISSLKSIVVFPHWIKDNHNYNSE